MTQHQTSDSEEVSLVTVEAGAPGGGGVFVHPRGLCESQSVGRGTRVWAFAHVLPKAEVGEDCNLCDGVFVENDVRLGNRVTVKCGVQVWDGVELEDDVFVGPNVTFTNDPFPRSRRHLENYPRTVVRKGASIGGNATILPGIEIGRGAMVGAGAVVTRSVPPNAIAVGNPARIVGYVDCDRTGLTPSTGEPATPAVGGRLELGIGGSALYEMPLVRDLRGSLTVAEFESGLPFSPARYFVVFDVPGPEVRGEHAHHQCHQFLICLKGSCTALVDDGFARREVRLDRPTVGLHIPPRLWGTQYRYSHDAALLVFASHVYDPEDYIRDYEEFRGLVLGDRAGTVAVGPA